MTVFKRVPAAIRGVGHSLLTHAAWVVFVVIVVQLITLQVSINAQTDRQARDDQAQSERRTAALAKALAQIKSDEQKNHQQTQRYVRCLIGIVLLPLNQRPSNTEQALDQCSRATSAESSRSTTGAVFHTPSSTGTVNQPTTSAPPDPSSNRAASAQTPANPLTDVRPLLTELYRTVKGVQPVGGVVQ